MPVRITQICFSSTFLKFVLKLKIVPNAKGSAAGSSQETKIQKQLIIGNLISNHSSPEDIILTKRLVGVEKPKQTGFKIKNGR